MFIQLGLCAAISAVIFAGISYLLPELGWVIALSIIVLVGLPSLFNLLVKNPAHPGNMGVFLTYIAVLGGAQIGIWGGWLLL